MADINLYGSLPGSGSTLATQELQVWAGRDSSQEFSSIVLNSTTVDARNSTTTLLSPGLVLGMITSTGNYVHYSPTATDGSEVAVAVLTVGTNMLDNTGAAAAKQGFIIAKGILLAESLGGLDAKARGQMVASGKFIFADDVQGRNAFLSQPIRQKAITANTTLVAADAGSLIHTLGANAAITITLPAIAKGLAFEILNGSNNALTITSTEGANIVWTNTVAANSLAFSTANAEIGGRLLFMVSDTATMKWIPRQLGPSGNTVTAG